MLKINDTMLTNDKEYDHYFMNNKNYCYIAVTKSNALFAVLLSKHDGNRYCLINIAKIYEIFKKHEIVCKACITSK